MNTRVSVEVGYAFDVHAPVKEVFALLSDVPASASHYPQLDRIVDLGGNAYRWEMQAIGVGAYALQTVYASRYTSDKSKGTVRWEPVEGVGNASVSGSWQIARQGKGTQLELQVQLETGLPIPPLMKPVVQPLLQAELERLTEAYIDSLIAHWGGEA